METATKGNLIKNKHIYRQIYQDRIYFQKIRLLTIIAYNISHIKCHSSAPQLYVQYATFHVHEAWGSGTQMQTHRGLLWQRAALRGDTSGAGSEKLGTEMGRPLRSHAISYLLNVEYHKYSNDVRYFLKK